MIESNLFIILLVVQCFVVSWYLPSLLYKRMRTVITQYPPTEFPLLYPKPEASYHAFHRKFRLTNQVLLIACLGIVLAIMLSDVNLLQDKWAMLPWGMFMMQMVPMVMVEASEFSHAKMLRQKNQNTVRVAGIQSRSLAKLISLPLFVSWLLIQLICVALIGWTDDFAFVVGDSAFFSVLIIVLANIAGVFYIRWLVVGRKLDPHQDPEDQFRAARAVTRSLVLISMGVSIFSAVMRLINFFEADHLEPLLMSVYCQLIALCSLPTTLKGMSLEKINFDVYKQSS